MIGIDQSRVTDLGGVDPLTTFEQKKVDPGPDPAVERKLNPDSTFEKYPDPTESGSATLLYTRCNRDYTQSAFVSV